MIKNCWICGNIADSEEHKFKASDIKRYHGKKVDAYYISGKITKLNSYKDKLLKFPKVICTNCNNNLIRPHDNAYDKFVSYCFKNREKFLKVPVIDFEDLYGSNWKTQKTNLYRYYAKHAGCKIVTSNRKADLTNLSDFIKGSNLIDDFIVRFEQKEGVKIIMTAFNQNSKYNHLFNSETCSWDNNDSSKFGGWLTNNYMTTNWVFGNTINSKPLDILSRKFEIILLTDSHFFDINKNENNDDEFSRLKFIDQYIIGFENGYNKSYDLKVKYFENLISLNNLL